MSKAFLKGIGGTGSSIEVSIPLAKNLTLNSDFMLSWTAPTQSEVNVAMGSLIKYAPVVHGYAVKVNGVIATNITAATSYSITDYLKEGTNLIEVITLISLTNDISAQSTTVYPYVLETLATKLPIGCNSSAIITYGDYVYLFGGIKGTGTPMDTIVKYNYTTGTIETLATKLPLAVFGSSIGSYGTNIYIAGGFYTGTSCTNAIFKFDTLTETVSTISTVLPVVNGNASYAVKDTTLYILGGSDGSQNSSTVYAFNMQDESITTLSNLPRGINQGTAALYGDIIYIFGGTGNTLMASVLAFSTVTGTTSTQSVSGLNINNRAPTACTLGSYIYLFTGEVSGSSSNYIYRFKPTELKFIRLGIRDAISATFKRAAVANNSIYIFGGYMFANNRSDSIRKMYEIPS